MEFKIRATSLFSLSALLLASACGAGSDRSVGKTAADFPPYAGGAAILFDDTIASEVFASDGTFPVGDDKTAARASEADFIAPAKIITVSREGRADAPGYRMTLAFTEPALVGALPAPWVTIDLAPGSPAFPWLRELGGRMVGTRLLLAGRRFRQDGTISLHWHAEADTEPVRALIRQAGRAR